MSDPAVALQAAVVAALRESASLATAMNGNVRLYELSPPDNAPFPYLVLGDDQIVGDDTECQTSSEAYVPIHIWARLDDDVSGTRAQAKAIAGAVRTALTAKLAPVGFEIVEWRFESTRHLTDPDLRTAHALVEFRYLIDPV